MLMQTKTFPQKPTRAIALHRAAYIFTRYDSDPIGRLSLKWQPISDQTSDDQPLALVAHPQKVASHRNATRLGELQPSRRSGHAIIKLALIFYDPRGGDC